MYNPSTACVSSRGSVSGIVALLHAPREEGGPGELDVAHARARQPSSLLLARRRAGHGDQALLGDEHAVAQDLVLGEIEQPVEQALERRTEILSLRRQPLEPLQLGLQRLGVDLEQAVELGLEVVIQRGRAEADVGGDVGPLRVLVSAAAEMLDRASSGSPDACCASSSGFLSDGPSGLLTFLARFLFRLK